MKKQWLNKWCLLGVSLAVSISSHGVLAGEAASKPNILYIVSDDQGWKDVGFHGSDIKTPMLDNLASEGAQLEQFYAQPMCTPTRAALMTGRYPFRYGLQTLVIPSAMTYGMPTDERTLPQALKDVGYRTVMIGKWHLGHADRKFWPMQRGFDYHYGPVLGEIDYYSHEAIGGVRDWYRDNRLVKESGYVTQLLGADAVDQIKKHDSSKPLFMYLAFTAPHAPYQAPQEYLDRYKDIEDPTRRAYAAMISSMDDEIARVIQALEKKGMRENTLVIFQSDNGGNRTAMLSGEVDVSRLTLPADNGPYRGGKGMLYEGGTRVAALANWPGHVKAGTVNGMIHVVDMFPTIASLAGADTTAGKPLDGLNVWTAISQGSASPRTEVIYNVEPFRAGIRQGDWKLVWRTPLPAALELYNLADDPSEQQDLAASHPEKVAELQKVAMRLASESAKPMFLSETVKAIKGSHAPAALPSEEAYFTHGD